MAATGPFTLGANTTAHPLGGCRMGATARRGRGRPPRPGVRHLVRAAPAGAVYPGLYVADASIIPTALGNNPLLTITALAERVADLLVTAPANAALFDAARART